MLAEWSLARPLRNVAILLAGSAVKLGLGFIASVLTYRALPPADAGRLTVVLSLVGVFSLVAEFGFRDAAVNYISGAASVAEAQRVARSFLAAKMLFGTLAAVLLAVLARWLLDAGYPGTVATDLLRLAALSLFAGGLLNYVQTLLEARQAFGALSLLSMAQAVVRAAAIALFFFTGRLALAPLIALEVFVPLALFVYGARFLPPGFVSLRRPLFEHFGKLWRFSRWIALAAVASTIFLSLDVLLLGHFRPAAEVGVYGVALALLAKFEVVQNVVLTTSFPEACRYHTKPELRAYLWRTLRLTGLASLGFLCLLPFTGWIIVFLYGSIYGAAAFPFVLLLIGLMIGINAQPAAFVLYPLNRPQWIAAGDLLQLAFCAAAGLWLIPLYGLLGAALTVLATRVLGGLITLALVTWQLR
jgi:O-antigen/teichoic acid export membrane protein